MSGEGVGEADGDPQREADASAAGRGGPAGL